MKFASGAELLAICAKKKIAISEAMLAREISVTEQTREEILSGVNTAWGIMRAAMQRSLDETLRSMGGLIGGQSRAVMARVNDDKSACGSLVARAAAHAMGVLEVNASMGLIVAAPTAGASGVLPGVLLALIEEGMICEDAAINGILCGGAVGYLVTRNASVSGAEAGCQAEVGTAASMAAAAVTEMLGGSPEQCLCAAGLAMSNMMGLVCDPVAGLVEMPCITRNAGGAANALTSAELALSGVNLAVPFDEVVAAMYEVGKNMPLRFRETAQGGIASTPTARAYAKALYKQDTRNNDEKEKEIKN